MRRLVLSAFIILSLAMSISAFAATAKVEWWPGESPTPKAAGTLAGQITAITGTTLTVQTESAGSPIFTIDTDTVVQGLKTSVADLKVGDSVVVNYRTLADGNVLAAVVRVVPTGSGWMFGSVTAVSSSAITIATEHNGPQTFAVTSTTRVRVKGAESTIDQVKVQDPAIIHFQNAGQGQTATVIRALAPGVRPPFSGSAAGAITALDSSGITVQTKSGPLIFTVNAATRFAIYGQRSTPDQFATGTNVEVGYNVWDDGTHYARSVNVPMPSYRGKIASVGPNGFVLTSGTQTINVAVAQNTKVTCHTYTGTLADLAPGFSATARGIPGPGTLQAVSVSFSPGEIKGTVASASGNTIVVTTIKGRVVTVTGTLATVITVRPRTAPNYPGTPADVKPGLAINVGGPRQGGAMTALWIDVMIP